MGLFSRKKKKEEEEKQVDENQLQLNKTLFAAVEKGDVIEAAAALKAGAQVNARHDFGRTPLFIAINKCNLQVAEMLLAEGADPNVPDTLYNHTPLVQVCRWSRTELVDLLLKYDADIKIADADGRGPLHHAARNGNRIIVDKLLAKGADVNEKDKKGNKPSVMAQVDYPRLAAYLRDKENPEEWRLVNICTVARISQQDAVGYQLTELFNFQSRSCTSVRRNKATNAESQAVKFFSEYDDTVEIEKAYSELVRLGGAGKPVAPSFKGLDK